LFDTIHFFFLLRRKTPIAINPSSPKNIGKGLASKRPSIQTAAIAIKSIPISSAILLNTLVHMLISTAALYRVSLERYL
jgi:hypothetical protein